MTKQAKTTVTPTLLKKQILELNDVSDSVDDMKNVVSLLDTLLIHSGEVKSRLLLQGDLLGLNRLFILLTDELSDATHRLGKVVNQLNAAA